MTEKERRPGTGTEATRSSLGATTSISTPSAERLVVATPSDRYRRRVFLTIAAAQRHADAARHAGREVHVYLAELSPVGEVAA